MNVSGFCIRHPVATILMSVSLVLAGLFAWRFLPVAALPRAEFPVVNVSAQLPGASPDTMATSVATPLIKQFATIAGIDSISTTNSQGSTSIAIQFVLNRDIDAAAADVQAAIARTQRQLPIEMTTQPSYRKVNPADAPIILMALKSDVVPLSQLDAFAQQVISPALSTVDGVAQVLIWGSQKYAVRIQIDPTALAARGIGLDELQAAITATNANTPVGTIQNSAQQLTIQAKTQLADAAQFANVIITTRSGKPVRLGDVAKVIDSVENTQTRSTYDGTPAIVLAVQRQPDANTVEVVDRVKAMIPAFEDQLPAAASLSLLNDRSTSIRQAVEDVQFTLLLTIALVVMVIFVFLRRVAATFIPAVAVPISIIATLAVMYLLNFSIDNISLLGLTLSVGLVVDDAIVMLENIVRHMEEDGLSAYDAALKGAGEIGFTIISISLSLVAVFIPVLLMGGVIGRIFNEFAVVVTVSILASAFVSLTLTPMLCSRLLSGYSEHHKENALGRWLEKGFDKLLAGYDAGLKFCLRFQPLMLLAFFLTMAGSVWLLQSAPKGFFPQEDIGQLPAVTISYNLPAGVALGDSVNRIEAIKDELGLPKSISTTLAGTAKTFQDSLANQGLLIAGAILTIYIVLGILYESFIHPLTILTGLPSAAVGALGALRLFDLELSVIAIIGLLMLIGIVKKNAIMMIDVALVLRREGKSAQEAIHQACVMRFRPILMTTLAALMGTLPIALGAGASAELRQPLGIAVVGGLMISQVLTLFITPVLFLYMDRLSEGLVKLGGFFRSTKHAPPPVTHPAE